MKRLGTKGGMKSAELLISAQRCSVGRLRGGYTLLEMLVVCGLVGVVMTLGIDALNESATIQRRVATWTNDDAAVSDLLARLAKDAATAQSAEVVRDSGGDVLVLRRADGQVTYQVVDGGARRLCRSKDGSTAGNSWALTRSSLRWVVEPATKGGAVVWTAVEIRDRSGRKSYLSSHYASAVRVGGRDRNLSHERPQTSCAPRRWLGAAPMEDES